MPNNAPLNFKERSVRRAIRAVHKEDLSIERIEIARDGTISVITAPRPKLDLANEIESLIGETRRDELAFMDQRAALTDR